MHQHDHSMTVHPCTHSTTHLSRHEYMRYYLLPLAPLRSTTPVRASTFEFLRTRTPREKARRYAASCDRAPRNIRSNCARYIRPSCTGDIRPSCTRDTGPSDAGWENHRCFCRQVSGAGAYRHIVIHRHISSYIVTCRHMSAYRHISSYIVIYHHIV